jgi:hypothetical protein
MWHLKKEQENEKEEDKDNNHYAYNTKPTVSELNDIMN